MKQLQNLFHGVNEGGKNTKKSFKLKKLSDLSIFAVHLLINMQSETTDKIRSYFKKHAEVAAVYLFGSYAKRKNRKYSDIDLGVLIKHEFTGNEEDL